MSAREVAPVPGSAQDVRDLAGEPLLQVRDLSVRFRTEDGPLSAVDGVSFDAHGGELLAVVGESGCGKSVTAMALSGLLPRSATVTGSVRLGGVELVGAEPATLRAARGREIAYIFQEPMTSLNPVFTVGRQISEVLRVHEGMGKREALDRAGDLLALVGIPSPRERLRQYPHQLSGGMRQRVMIAMSVACNPRVLVADEPTTALDVTVQAGFLDAARVHGTRQRLREIPGLVPVLAEQPDACTFADRCPAADDLCRTQRPPLERAPHSAHEAACWHPATDASASAGNVSSGERR
jgi:peptide/nickel transport system ATP-binding protein